MTRPSSHPALTDARTAFNAGERLDGLRHLGQLLGDPQADYATLQAAGRLYWSQDALAGAEAMANRADERDPLDADFQSIRHAMDAQRFADAEAIAQRMLAREPGHARALYTLAHLARIQRRPQDFLSHVEVGLATAPGNMILRHMHVAALEDTGRETEALIAARRLPEIERSAASVLELGRILQRYGHNEELIALFEDAVQDVPFTPEQRGGMDLVRGHALRVLGRREAAEAAYKRCIAGRTPASPEAWWALSDLTTYRFSDAEVRELEVLVADTRLPEALRSQPAFALAKARESRDGLASAFADYRRANALYGPRSFDPEAYTQAVGRITEAMTPGALASQADAGAVHAQSQRPVFILGMPRSGSTLLEQILASHSAIEGTQELPVLPTVKQSLHQFCVDRFGGAYLDHIGAIPAERLAEAGKAYLAQAAVFRREDTPVFLDKLPQNFEHVGLIHKILPEAVIIDIRRHPLACGVSLFRQYFASGWSWAYDLSHIGTYYRGYMTLMDHWDRVLPGRVLHVRYEALVADMRGTVEAIMARIGLPFEVGMLDFHKTQRAVRTPSSEQVRQPVYAGSVDSWRAVEGELGPLKAALGPNLVARYETG